MSGQDTEKKLKAFLKSLFHTKAEPGVKVRPEGPETVAGPSSKPEAGRNRSPVQTTHTPGGTAPAEDSPLTDGGNHGLVWIEGGRVQVRNPVGDGRRARIGATNKLQLLINGQPVTGMALLTEADQIVVEPVVEHLEPELQLEISPDGLEAHLTIKCGRVLEYVPADQGPQFNLMLEAEARIREVIPPTKEMALDLINRKGVRFGINYPYLKEIFDQPVEGSYLVARGRPPRPGEPDRVEYFFALSPFVEKDGDRGEPFDFREIRQLQSVEAGDCLAVLRRGTPGEPGNTVRGDVILPPKQESIELIAGPGTRLLDEGLRVVATTSGLPTARVSRNRVVFSVQPVFVHEGDLTPQDQNIRFRGNVHIKGNVGEGMTVEAAENVLVAGTVNQAKIAAVGHLQVGGNVFASNLQAGCSLCCSLQTIRPQLEQITQSLELLIHLARELMKSPVFQEVNVTFNLLVLNLIEVRFPRLRAQVYDLCTRIRKTAPAMPDELKDLVNLLERNFTGVVQFGDIQDLEELYHKSSFICSCLENETTSCADASLPYAVNSRIEATGRVFIFGKGIYHCTVIAGGDVDINGVLRGGFVLAKGNVYVKEAGSLLGVATRITVPENRKISIARAHADVVVQVGPRSYRLPQPMRLFKARLLQDGKLDLNGLSWDGESH